MKPLPFLILLSLANAGMTGAADQMVMLSGGGSLIWKEEHQTIGTNCIADRKWVEVFGLPSKAVEEKINSWIRKSISVGQKLTGRSCPDKESGESYRYYNTVDFTGQHAALLGLKTSVHFPGGTGRHVIACVSVDTMDGSVIRFERLLTKEGRKLLATEYCKQIAADPLSGEKKDYYCELGKYNAVNDSIFCLKDDGIEALAPFNGNWRMIGSSIKIPFSETSKYFLYSH